MDQVSFDPPTASRGEDPSGQRSAARDSLMLSATLRISGRSDVTVRVRNLSAGGLMAEYADPVRRGESLDIEVRGIGWVGGAVAWVAEGRIGVAFDRAIDPMAARKPVGKGASTPVYAKPVLLRR
jgi:hypothetical protein